MRDKIPTHPKHLRLHKQWILTSKQREELFKAKNKASLQRYNRISTILTPLKPRTRVLILTQGRNPRWTQSGIVVTKLPFRQYRIKLDGSGRIIQRNRRFLRAYSRDNDLYMEQSSMELPSPLPKQINTEQMSPPATRLQLATQSSFVPAELSDNHNSNTSDMERIPKKLQPFNNPGLLENEVGFEYRTTRSNRHY